LHSPAVPLLIDTYNVLHVTGVLPPDLAGIDAAGLVDLLALSRYRRMESCLVCDGVPRPGMPVGAVGHARVVYAGGERSADEVIEAMIARCTAPRRMTVVSSDRQIARSARRRRCRTLRAETFLGHLAHDAARSGGHSKAVRKPNPPLPASHVDTWVRLFGLTENDLSLPAADLWWVRPRPGDAEPGDEIDPDDLDMRRILGER
ncbi:MAG: NYN domain-containing protein, partial [Phycisphaerales bacterium]|nr:NYN domain-containing protein [Phycisphaerales bacterium]